MIDDQRAIAAQFLSGILDPGLTSLELSRLVCRKVEMGISARAMQLGLSPVIKFDLPGVPVFWDVRLELLISRRDYLPVARLSPLLRGTRAEALIAEALLDLVCEKFDGGLHRRFAIDVPITALLDDRWLHRLELLSASRAWLAAFLVIQVDADDLEAFTKSEWDRLQRARKLGCSICLKVRSGNRTLATKLTEFEFDCLRIDASSVRDVVRDSSGRIELRSLASFAHHHGLLVIADELGSPDDIGLLTQIGVDCAAGPVAEAQIADCASEPMSISLGCKVTSFSPEPMFPSNGSLADEPERFWSYFLYAGKGKPAYSCGYVRAKSELLAREKFIAEEVLLTPVELPRKYLSGQGPIYPFRQ